MPLFAVAFALTIAPAFASYGGHMSGTTNNANTLSVVKSNSNTGGNDIMNNKPATTTNDKHSRYGGNDQTTCNTCGANTIVSGNAGALAGALNATNTNVNVGGKAGSTTNNASTKSVVVANANTGNNSIEKNVGGTNTIVTGDASSTAVGINLVNTNVSVGH